MLQRLLVAQGTARNLSPIDHERTHHGHRLLIAAVRTRILVFSSYLDDCSVCVGVTEVFLRFQAVLSVHILNVDLFRRQGFVGVHLAGVQNVLETRVQLSGRFLLVAETRSSHR